MSPYIFLRKPTARELRKAQNDASLLPDNEYAIIQNWLSKDPERTVEIITNSVLTNDNPLVQMAIDQGLAPGLTKLQKDPAVIRQLNELGDSLLSQAEWEEIVAQKRVQVWEYARKDDPTHVRASSSEKIHAKATVVDDRAALLSTSNMDERSRRRNSESGLIMFNEEITKQMYEHIETLKSYSVLWGSPEWQQIRENVIERGGIRGRVVKDQEKIYKFLEEHLNWLLFQL